jgi:hypothetical protein
VQKPTDLLLDVKRSSHVFELAPKQHVFVPFEVNLFGQFFLGHGDFFKGVQKYAEITSRADSNRKER